DVEHDEVVVFLGAGPQGELSRFGVVYSVSRLAERARKPVRQRFVVFDNQNAHGKCLNRFKLQDSTRTVRGLLDLAGGHALKKKCVGTSPLPRHRGGKRLRKTLYAGSLATT